MTDWQPDVLGAGFERHEIDLGKDDEGPVCATLVRTLPEPLGVWRTLRREHRTLENCDVLYVHGWSDYFFQASMARFFTDRGARFHALDLRKYGRSLRKWQTPGYITDLEEYDAEIEASLEIIRAEGGGGSDGGADSASSRPLLLFGHSTGGLILSLWAGRHHGVAEAVLLNSPWLELQLSGVAAKALASMVSVRARLTPHELSLPQLDLGFYTQAQRTCSDPAELKSVNLEWRPEHTMPVRAAWLRAVMEGHARVGEGIDVGAPAYVLLSARSRFGVSWNNEMLHADTVLEVDSVARAALKLGPTVTVERIDGALHDVFLSESSVRAHAYEQLDRWLVGWRAARPRSQGPVQ